MKNNFTKTNLFSCPIYKIRIDPNSYDKEKIINDILYNKGLKNIRNASRAGLGHCDVHHSFHDVDNEDFRIINYEKLTDVYRKKIQMFFDKEIITLKPFLWEFDIVNYLAVTEGQWLSSHIHTHDDFACVHYLNFKDEHSPTLFWNPATFASYIKSIQPNMQDVIDLDNTENSYACANFSLRVEEDDMVIFPALLNHEIRAQGPTKEPRITISTNIQIRKYEKSND